MIVLSYHTIYPENITLFLIFYHTLSDGLSIERPTSIKRPLVDTQGWPLNGAGSTGTVFLLTISDKNGLLFTEMSALDSTNVETVFINLLTG